LRFALWRETQAGWWEPVITAVCPFMEEVMYTRMLIWVVVVMLAVSGYTAGDNPPQPEPKVPLILQPLKLQLDCVLTDVAKDGAKSVLCKRRIFTLDGSPASVFCGERITCEYGSGPANHELGITAKMTAKLLDDGKVYVALGLTKTEEAPLARQGDHPILVNIQVLNVHKAVDEGTPVRAEWNGGDGKKCTFELRVRRNDRPF
jgi:hypothetical protein